MRSDTSVELKTTTGSALVEVLVAIVLASLLLGLVLHADLAVNRSLLRWTARAQLEQAAVTLATRLRSDIFRADSIPEADSALLRLYIDGEAVEYTIREGTIERNGVALLDSKCRTTVMRIESSDGTRWHRSADRDPGGCQIRTLKLALKREGHAAQSVFIPIRPYSKIHVE